jgi:hypothetical protein
MSVRLIKLAVIYLMVGMTLGVFMGATHNFQFRSVHAHINLLGWASLALAALVFHIFPDLARTRLSAVWFWVYNISLPITLGALAFFLAGQQWAQPVLAASELFLWASGILFAINVLWNLRSAEAAAVARGAPVRA